MTILCCFISFLFLFLLTEIHWPCAIWVGTSAAALLPMCFSVRRWQCEIVKTSSYGKRRTKERKRQSEENDRSKSLIWKEAKEKRERERERLVGRLFLCPWEETKGDSVCPDVHDQWAAAGRPWPVRSLARFFFFLFFFLSCCCCWCVFVIVAKTGSCEAAPSSPLQ